jgi:hypothetical protein
METTNMNEERRGNTPHRKCSSCEERFPLNSDNFHRNKTASGGYGYLCKECSSEKGRPYYERNREAVLARTRKNRNARYRELKLAAYDAYGGPVCSCCGEAREDFLCLDHIEGDGAEHRKTVNTGEPLYRWLKDNDYPYGFQVLCHNCNMGKSINGGICPHIETNVDIEYPSVDELVRFAEKAAFSVIQLLQERGEQYGEKLLVKLGEKSLVYMANMKADRLLWSAERGRPVVDREDSWKDLAGYGLLALAIEAWKDNDFAACLDPEGLFDRQTATNWSFTSDPDLPEPPDIKPSEMSAAAFVVIDEEPPPAPLPHLDRPDLSLHAQFTNAWSTTASEEARVIELPEDPGAGPTYSDAYWEKAAEEAAEYEEEWSLEEKVGRVYQWIGDIRGIVANMRRKADVSTDQA